MGKPWNLRIAEAKRRGEFTDEDIADAESWMSCAVGEAHEIYEKVVYNDEVSPSPIDEKLFALGFQFYPRVRTHDMDSARDIYNQIQVRVKELNEEVNDA